MNIRCDEAKISAAPEPMSPALPRTVFSRRPSAAWTVTKSRYGRSGGGVPDSLDEAKAAFRAAGERPLSLE